MPCLYTNSYPSPTLPYMPRLLTAGPLVRCIFACVQCCLWCFETCLQYINRNAYIETAIYGYSFCRGQCEGSDVVTIHMTYTRYDALVLNPLIYLPIY